MADDDDGYVASFKSILLLGNIVGVAQFALADSQRLSALRALLFVPFAVSYVGLAYDGYRHGAEDMLREEVVMLSYGVRLVFCANALATLVRFPYYGAARRSFRRAILDVNEINKRLGLRRQYDAHTLKTWATCAAFVGCDAFVRRCAADARWSIEAVFFAAGVVHYSEIVFGHKLLGEMAAQCQHLHRVMFDGLQFVNESGETECAKWTHRQNGRCVTHDALRSAYLDKFVELAQVHLEICRCAKQVNKLFGVPFMLLIIVDFATVTLTLYDLCNAIVALNPATHTTVEAMKICGDCVQILIVFARQAISIYSWSHLNKNLKETVLKIHKLWNVLSIDDRIGTWAGCIQLTTVQLSNPIPTFSASDIVDIDWPVIISIISAASTYVVILIQFGSIRRTVKEKGLSGGAPNAPIPPAEEIILFPA